MTTAFYPGSFDPMTNGHLDVLVQSLNVASKVIVAIGIHPGKAPLFTFDERATMTSQTCEPTRQKPASSFSPRVRNKTVTSSISTRLGRPFTSR